MVKRYLYILYKDIYNYADDRIIIIIVGNKLDLLHDGIEVRCIA